MTNRRLKVGLIANEFFDAAIGRLGGFGISIAQVARGFANNPDVGVDAVFLTGELRAEKNRDEVVTHKTRLLLRSPSWWQYRSRIRKERFDVLFSMDYRPTYESICWAAPLTPLIVWVHDTRPSEDIQKILTLRVPGNGDHPPLGIRPIDCRSLQRVVRGSKLMRRPVAFGAPADRLRKKMLGTYGVNGENAGFLPNIIDDCEVSIRKHERPRVIFLGRLDPIKRPWIFAELAKRFPEVEFLFLGKTHFQAKGAWVPDNLPPNVRLMGHVEGRQKAELLSSAWVLVNTSIHESLAISFLEALMYETPIVSCQDPDQVVSRFGDYVGRWDGDGLAGLPRFEQGLRTLLGDRAIRYRLGQEGRAWVRANHSWEGFLKGFRELCARANVTAHA